MSWLFLGGALLVVGGWIGYRKRMRRLDAGLTDAQLRGIENAGRVEVDEPLDLREAEEEEQRFWGESWDEPEPW